MTYPTVYEYEKTCKENEERRLHIIELEAETGRHDAAKCLAERDATRYRYMRDNAAFIDRNGPGLYWYLPRWDGDLPLDERLDQAIDAAIQDTPDSQPTSKRKI